MGKIKNWKKDTSRPSPELRRHLHIVLGKSFDTMEEWYNERFYIPLHMRNDKQYRLGRLKVTIWQYDPNPDIWVMNASWNEEFENDEGKSDFNSYTIEFRTFSTREKAKKAALIWMMEHDKIYNKIEEVEAFLEKSIIEQNDSMEQKRHLLLRT